jgi:thymidylate synthase
MNTIDKKYTDLLQDILDNGVTKQDRTGTGTLSVFGRQIRHKMSEGFPLITTKKMYFKGIVTELLWFLRGDTNIKYLIDNNCHIWDGDCYQAYVNKIKLQNNWEVTLRTMDVDTIGQQELLSQEEFINKIKTDDKFANKWGELGPIYGRQWRRWDSYNFVDDEVHTIKIDQIANSINLLKTDPDSRRNRVNAWNVGELDQMVLPPCHTDFQFYTRELSDDERQKWVIDNVDWVRNAEDPKHEANKYLYRGEPKIYGDTVPKRAISLMWNQRSVDTFLGLPFNIASYGLLLEIIAKAVNMVPDELIGNLGDTHLYLNHIEQAKEQIGRDLSLEERQKLYEDEFTPGIQVANDNWLNSKLTTRNVPKRTREPFPLPTLVINDEFWNQDDSIFNQIEHITPEDFFVENYQSHPTIKAPLSN